MLQEGIPDNALTENFWVFVMMLMLIQEPDVDGAKSKVRSAMQSQSRTRPSYSLEEGPV
jgi:hypothetical protein